MKQEIIVANANFEDLVEDLKAKIDNIEAAKEEEKERVFAEIEAKYEIRLSKFNQILSDPEVTHIEEIEVEDETESDDTEIETEA